MTLLDVRRLTTYAKDHPPLRWLVARCAAALGVELPKPKTEEKKPSQYMTAEQARAFAAAANAAMRTPNG